MDKGKVSSMDAQADGRQAGVTADSTSLISVELPIDARSAWQSRRTVEPLRDLIAPQAFDDLRLVVTELVTNAVRHAGADRWSAVARPLPSRAGRGAGHVGQWGNDAGHRA